MADIFFDGRVYVGALLEQEYYKVWLLEDGFKWERYLNEIPKERVHLVQSPHPFTDGQDVTGLYELQYQYRNFLDKDYVNISKKDYELNNCDERKRVVAIPTEPPTPVNKSEGEGIEKEAVELVEKFKPFAHGYETVASGGQLLQNAKQCALRHCDLMIEEYSKSPRYLKENKTKHYTDLKQSINKL